MKQAHDDSGRSHYRKGASNSTRWSWLCAIALLVPTLSSAASVTINVVDPSGSPVSGFRWVAERDETFEVIPGETCLDLNLENCPSTHFHRSYMPVVDSGDSTSPVAELDPDARHFVSVLPYAGYTMGGASIARGQTSVTVVVNSTPIPTSQIRIFAFEDNYPIDNAANFPEEPGLPGFQVKLAEAGGRYGVSGGDVYEDAFGNPIGTTYVTSCPGGGTSCPEFGDVDVMGDGVILTDADGIAVIKNLVPGKYGIQVVPPAGARWQQTTTMEGSRTIDAWVEAGNPSFFVELGAAGPHVLTGFVRQENFAALTGNATIQGTVHSLHNSRPPAFDFFTGPPFPACWVGLNDLAFTPRGKGIAVAPCDEDSGFSLQNVPPGNYSLVVWDQFLGLIIAQLNVTVSSPNQTINLGAVPVFPWFGRVEAWVFNDKNENGFRDCVTADCDDPVVDEIGIPEQNVNLRFRDGSIYQAFPTDLAGFVPFDEVFPFFNWLVAEVDFARLKATGATVIVDAGGEIPPDAGWDTPSRGVLNPQPQVCTLADVDDPENPCTTIGTPILNPNTGNNLSKTETGEVLVEAFQTFLGQTVVMEFGKASYGPDQNGGISGIVFYGVTRAEDDPRYAVGEEWEPGVPRVQVNLYESDRDGVIVDSNGSGGFEPADVDNHPFGWRDGGPKGPEDIDRDDPGGIEPAPVFDPGDAVRIVTTDSWDDSLPTGCQGDVFYVDGVEDAAHATDCFDGLRNFGQVRPGVFDGGYAFTDLERGYYTVEAVPPPHYETLREEHRNVDFGDEYVPRPLLLPAKCVGEPHLVPQYMSLQTDDGGSPLPGIGAADLVDAPFAGETRPLCDRKVVRLARGVNAAADFFLLTDVNISSHVTGGILDDLSNEFDPNSPSFGEKYAPPFLPASFRDFAGNEIARTYSDRWGKYNLLLPSTYSAYIPMPSGYAPNMLTACMNDPGPIPNPDFDPGAPISPNNAEFITDPYFRPEYSQFCYTFQYMPGTTTYLDTPVLPIAAFTGPDQNALDCEFPDGTPVIYSVSGPQGGPYVPAAGDLITIASLGTIQVPNPLFDVDAPPPDNVPTVPRDFGFGPVQGDGSVSIGGVELTVTAWSNGAITATVPAAASSGQLTVTRDSGVASRMGVTVTVGPITGAVTHVSPSPSGYPDTPIQDAIDAALPGDLILIAPGVYDEAVILWKELQVQGWGAPSTIINAAPVPGSRVQDWRDKVTSLITDGSVHLLPSQTVGDPVLGEPGTLPTEEGAGFVVLAQEGGFTGSPNARIDGFSITGAVHAGGISVNAFANDLEIGNNRIFTNRNDIGGGGIRIGQPFLKVQTPTGQAYDDGKNDRAYIHHNKVFSNGSKKGAGGGISINHGTDGYRVTDNWVCGNYTSGDGAGIGHLGFSDDGLIANNTVIFNQAFNQGIPCHGGGIAVGGAPPLVGSVVSPGAGSVLIDRNLILGNLAGAGDAGGVRISNLNGEDVAADGADRSSWDTVQLINNWIVNNVAGLAGGAISLENSAAVDILHNTIANNDSIATAGLAFAPGSPNVSTRQPAGIVARAHSSALAALFTGAAADAYGVFSNPRLANNTIWHNRQFNFFVNDGGSPPFGLSPDVEADPGSEVFSDLAVLPAGTGQLEPRNCVLSDTPANRAAYTGDFNIFGDPGFVRSYSNGRLGQHVLIPEFKTSLAAVPAFDEGGNMIDVRYGPLALRDPTTSLRYGDYHLTPCAAAKDVGDGTPLAGAPLELATDIDGDERPELGTAVDIGADENFGFCDDACPQDPAKTEPGICGCGVPDTDGDGDGTADCVDGCPADPDKTAPGDCGCGTPETDTDGDSSPDCVDLCDDDPLKTDPGDCGCGNPDVDADGSGVSDCLELGDVVEIVLARYQPFGPTVGGLTVWAISSETPSVSLFLQGYGEMDYFPSEGPYYVFERIVFGGVGPTVTVNSSGGGTDTVSIPFPSGAPNQTTPGRGPERIGRTGQRPISASIGSLFGRYSGSRRSLSAKLDSGGPVDPDPGTASTPDPDAPLGIGGDEISKGTSPIEYAVPTVATLPASIAVQCPGDLDGDAIIDAPDPAHPNAKCMHITAGDSFLRMADEQPGGRPIYAFGFSDVTGIPEDQVMEQGILAGQFPAPLIAVDEGDELYLTMTNVGMLIRPDLFDPHTVHWHGFPNAADIFDGLPEVTISINMGASLTYYYNVVHPGTYMYHCHVEATEHMQMGMLGNLYVRPAQNGTVFGDPDGSGRSYDKFVYNDGDGSTGYDVEYPIQIGSFDSAFHDASETVQPLPFAEMRDDYPLLNGRGYPDTINTATFVNDAGKPTQIEHSLIRAVAGEKVLLRISNLNVTRHYTLGTLGIPMRVVGMDARLARGPGGEDLSYSTNSVTLGGGQSVDVILDTLGIPPGTYFLFTTNLNYLSNSDEDLGGMMTEIVVEPAVP